MRINLIRSTKSVKFIFVYQISEILMIIKTIYFTSKFKWMYVVNSQMIFYSPKLELNLVIKQSLIIAFKTFFFTSNECMNV